ncbi:MAG TPA: autotransporter-associated beta strand repeat-containing protein, partial [Candidatus Paceibacterota bacterium]|nr:autotransporter-associated beta strand repeat-containing protein [Candidatus Paceibacterota bacterium]
TLWSGNQANPTTPNGEVDLNRGSSSAANNTFNLNGGVLTTHRVMTFNSGGTTAFNFNGGTLRANSSATDFVTFAGASQTANIMGGGAIIDSAGFNIAIPQMLLAGATGNGGLTKIGNGTLTLSGGYTYTGPTVVRGGTLALDASQTSSSASVLTVSNAALAVSTANGTAPLYAGGLTLVGTNVININFGSATQPTSAALYLTGIINNTGTNIINITGPLLVVGTYPLIYTGGSVPTNNFKLGPLPTGMLAVLEDSGTSLDLHVTAAGQSLTWYGADSLGNPLTTWNINSSMNWNAGTAKYLQYSGNSYGDNVAFDDTVYPGSTSITLNTRVVPSTVVFSSTAQAYSLTGTGGIDGATAVVVTNTGTVFLGTSNNYTGGTFIGGGTLSITNDSALGTNTGSVVLAGGTLQFDASATSSRNISLTANSALNVAAGTTVGFGGSVTGSGTLDKTGDGILNLPAPNAISVAATVSAGVIKLSNANAATNGSIGPNIDNGLIFTSGIGTFNVGGIVGASALDLTDTAASPVTLSVGGNNSDSTFTGPISGSGSLTKVGTGIFSLNAASTYSGNTTVSGGVLAAQAKFDASAGPVTITTFSTGNITVNNGGQLRLSSAPTSAFGDYLYANNITVNNGSVLSFDGFNHITGTLNVAAGGGTLGSTFDNHSDALNADGFAKGLFVDGLVTGTGNLTVQQSGLEVSNPWDSSTVYFTSTGTAAQNTYSGTITVNPFLNGSYLYLIGTNALANATIVLAGDNTGANARMGVPTLLFGSGTTNAGVGYATIGGLAGSGSLVLAETLIVSAGTAAGSHSYGAPFALTVGNNNASTTYSGVMSGEGSLIKVGSGTLTLTGTNTYKGNTTVNGGILAVGQPTLATNSTVSIATGAKLQLNFSGNNQVGALMLNGVSQPNGIYNAANTPAYFAGTGSLAIGVNIATNPTNITFSVSGGTLSLSWPADHLGWILQSQTNSLAKGLSTNWVDVAGSESMTGTNIPVNSTVPATFYRLRKP